MAEVREIFDGIFMVDGKLATSNLVSGKKVYGEELKTIGDMEYRIWNPYRSKLAAAILNRMSGVHIKRGSRVLYLGAATGTTSSHVSDIVGNDGAVYCVEISERNLRELLKVCEARGNMFPILGDARYVDRYSDDIGAVDVIYQDISARDQARILLVNSVMLRKGGHAYVAIKSQSISIAKKPAEIYKEFLKEAGEYFDVSEKIDILPYDKMHMFVHLEKR
jgi:fibrillarin-like pre-rRNA processing protein